MLLTVTYYDIVTFNLYNSWTFYCFSFAFKDGYRMNQVCDTYKFITGLKSITMDEVTK